MLGSGKELSRILFVCSCLWKVELDMDKIGYLYEEISKQSAVVAWYLLTAYRKMWEERNDLETELLIK